MTTTAATAAPAPPTRPRAASPDATIAGRRLADLTVDTFHHRLGHGQPLTLDNLAGYVVRLTIVAGVDANIDVAVVDSPAAYADAYEVAWQYRTRGADLTPAWGWAVVDRVYACGCRS